MPEHGNIGSECDEGTDGYLIHSDYDNTCKIKGNNSQAPAEIDDRTDGVIQADRMDNRSSWTKAFRLEDFFRWICHLL